MQYSRRVRGVACRKRGIYIGAAIARTRRGTAPALNLHLPKSHANLLLTDVQPAALRAAAAAHRGEHRHAHAVHMQCTCSAHAVHMHCACTAHTCTAHALHMHCTCTTHALHMHCTCTAQLHMPHVEHTITVDCGTAIYTPLLHPITTHHRHAVTVLTPCYVLEAATRHT